MKKTITLSILMILALLSANMRAQSPVKLGFKAGVSVSTLWDDVDEPDARAGFTGGVNVKVNLPYNLFILSGADFTMKGANDNYHHRIGLSTESKYSPMYLQVPLHLGYRWQLPTLALNFSGGPYYAYGIGGKAKGALFYDGRHEKLDIFDDKVFKKSDYGIGARVGLEIVGLEIAAGYDLGLTDVWKGSGEVRNAFTYLTVGYYFF